MKNHDDFQDREYIFEYPPYSPQDLRRREGTLTAAKLMINAALTAPFAGGVSHVEVELVYGQDAQEQIARKIEELAYANKVWEEMFKYEAVMVRESDAVIFLGSRMAADNALDGGCGICGGKPDCSYFYEGKKSKYGLVDNTDRRSEPLIYR